MRAQRIESPGVFALPFFLGVFLAGMLSCASPGPRSTIDPLEDSARQRAMVDSIAQALAAPMAAREAEAALLVELEDLYLPLSLSQRAFLEAIRHLDGADPARGLPDEADWVRVEGQRVTAPTGVIEIGLQLLPRNTAEALEAMNVAMRADLGRGLIVGSGYRTPAYQLFVFVTYMSYYEYSTSATQVHVSLPGASDHNRPERQGIDFVSESGIDLKYSDAEAFKRLEEYRWLAKNADRFGFRDEGAGSASPWHWYHDTSN
jgi:hypothetical protein